jgi:hypothetical protein
MNAVGALRAYHQEKRMTSTSDPADRGLLLRRLATLAGWLSLFATLALLSPGVVATARADQATGNAGPSCQADPSGEQMSMALAQMIERLRAQAETGDRSDGHAVVLNTRGYNYGPAAPEPVTLDSDRGKP